MAADTVAIVSRGGRYRVLGLVGLGHFLSHFYLLVLPPMFPLLAETLGVGYVALGLSMTIFNVMTGLTQTPVGFLVDRLGPRALLVGGLALEGLAFCAIGIFANYAALIVFMAVAGLANSVFHPADYAILSSAVERRHIGRAFSFHTFAGWAGAAVAPATMALMIAFVDWRWAVISAGLMGVGAALVLALNGRWLDVAPKAPEGQRRDGDGRGAGGLATILTPPILLCFVFYIGLALSTGGINGFVVAVLVQEHGFQFNDAVTALSGFLVGTAVGILLGGLIADWTRHHEAVAVTGLLAGAVVTLALAWATPGPALLMLVLAVAGLCFGMIIPSRDMLVRSLTPPDSVGKVFGFVSSGFNVGGVIAPLLFGFILDGGHGDYFFYLVAVFMLLSAGTVFATRLAR